MIRLVFSVDPCVIGICVRDDGCGIPELVWVIRLVFSVIRGRVRG